MSKQQYYGNIRPYQRGSYAAFLQQHQQQQHQQHPYYRSGAGMNHRSANYSGYHGNGYHHGYAHYAPPSSYTYPGPASTTTTTATTMTPNTVTGWTGTTTMPMTTVASSPSVRSKHAEVLPLRTGKENITNAELARLSASAKPFVPNSFPNAQNAPSSSSSSGGTGKNQKQGTAGVIGEKRQKRTKKNKPKNDKGGTAPAPPGLSLSPSSSSPTSTSPTAPPALDHAANAKHPVASSSPSTISFASLQHQKPSTTKASSPSDSPPGFEEKDDDSFTKMIHNPPLPPPGFVPQKQAESVVSSSVTGPSTKAAVVGTTLSPPPGFIPPKTTVVKETNEPATNATTTLSFADIVSAKKPSAWNATAATTVVTMISKLPTSKTATKPQKKELTPNELLMRKHGLNYRIPSYDENDDQDDEVIPDGLTPKDFLLQKHGLCYTASNYYQEVAEAEAEQEQQQEEEEAVEEKKVPAMTILVEDSEDKKDKEVIFDDENFPSILGTASRIKGNATTGANMMEDKNNGNAWARKMKPPAVDTCASTPTTTSAATTTNSINPWTEKNVATSISAASASFRQLTLKDVLLQDVSTDITSSASTTATAIKNNDNSTSKKAGKADNYMQDFPELVATKEATPRPRGTW